VRGRIFHIGQLRPPLIILATLLLGACLQQTYHPPHAPAAPRHGMVVAGHPAAADIGVQIMQAGGNAFDAAVAVQFALAVAYPGAGNLGGGGFAVLHTDTGATAALDFRETAPAKSHRDMYLDSAGAVIPRASLDGALAVGVPGSVDGMARLHDRYGKLPWSRLLQPAIDLARNGVELTAREAHKYNRYREAFLTLNTTPPPLVRFDRPWQAGDTLKQPELARALESIRKLGRNGFYRGELADRLAAGIRRAGGLVSEQDLQNYRAVWRQPVNGSYRGYQIHSMPPPSSGGVALLQLLQAVEPYPIADWGSHDTRTIHLLTEIERRVYADRAAYLGDPDQVDVPVKKLLDPDYLKQRMADISPDAKTDSDDIGPGQLPPAESLETTHFSIADSAGNAIAVTTTLNSTFGSKLMVPGTGFFLNNEMDDFSSKPGVPNQFGLVGSEANAIAPGKRMLSSMTPTIVEKEGKPFLVLGSPGGSTIITSVLQVILNIIDHRMPLQEAVNAKRVHHQWLPDRILAESGALSPETELTLKALGHVIVTRKSIGQVNAIEIAPDGTLSGAADVQRGDNQSAGF